MNQDHDQEWKRLGRPSISDRVSPNSTNDAEAVNAGRRSHANGLPARPTGPDPDQVPANTIGAWLFRHRTLLPLPIAVAILVIPSGQTRAIVATILAGATVTAVGEAIRLWGVRQIGTISRTRSERLGPLVETGPFSLVRNPLYLGNIALWAGFALTARLVWLVPLIVVLLAVEYHAIVRWEEGLLEGRLGDAYRDYKARVPRWLPKLQVSRLKSDLKPAFSWRDTLFSERGTLIAIAAGYLLLWLKVHF
jgi:protein-S-isoprenylcysteine O-methyltransferase Ste14